MFTGIVEGTATVAGWEARPEGRRLWTRGLPGGLTLGQSVALNGACLTVAVQDEGRVGFDLAGETLARTSLGDLEEGRILNYERALCLGDRLDGHFVQGHVDDTGVLRELAPEGDDWWLVVEAPERILAATLLKGSIAVDGISLTVARLTGSHFAATIIPHTREVTNLRERSPGDRVNLEADMIGKWVQRLVQPLAPQ